MHWLRDSKEYLLFKAIETYKKLYSIQRCNSTTHQLHLPHQHKKRGRESLIDEEPYVR